MCDCGYHHPYYGPHYRPHHHRHCCCEHPPYRAPREEEGANLEERLKELEEEIAEIRKGIGRTAA